MTPDELKKFCDAVMVTKVALSLIPPSGDDPEFKLAKEIGRARTIIDEHLPAVRRLLTKPASIAPVGKHPETFPVTIDEMSTNPSLDDQTDPYAELVLNRDAQFGITGDTYLTILSPDKKRVFFALKFETPEELHRAVMTWHDIYNRMQMRK